MKLRCLLGYLCGAVWSARILEMSMNWIYKSESQQSLVIELDEITKEVDTDRKNKQALEHCL